MSLGQCDIMFRHNFRTKFGSTIQTSTSWPDFERHPFLMGPLVTWGGITSHEITAHLLLSRHLTEEFNLTRSDNGGIKCYFFGN